MTGQKQNLKILFSGMTEYFTPKIIGEVNEVYVKLAKVIGQDVPWHTHDNEDEMFYVIKGCLSMEIKGRNAFSLNQGELFIVKQGIEHRVHSEKECCLMLIENKSTKHTGDIQANITKTVEQQFY